VSRAALPYGRVGDSPMAALPAGIGDSLMPA